MSSWNADGRTTVTAVGADSTAALSAALTALVEAVCQISLDARTGERATLALSLRAEASSVATLFLNLSNSLLDLLSDADVLPNAVRIDGLLRTDDGLTAWGYLLGEPAENPPPIEGATVEACDVAEEGPSIRIEASLVRQSPPDIPNASDSSE